jgi:hypothetical protein
VPFFQGGTFGQARIPPAHSKCQLSIPRNTKRIGDGREGAQTCDNTFGSGRRLPIDDINRRAAIIANSHVGEIASVGSCWDGTGMGDCEGEGTAGSGVDFLAAWDFNLFPWKLVTHDGIRK